MLRSQPITLLLMAFCTLSCDVASALVVKTWNGAGTPNIINDTAPADDPGWHNVGTMRSSIYLGDQWMLTANHVGTGTIELPSGTYSAIPGTTVTLTNPASFAGRSLSASSDLRMFRIKPESSTGLTPEELDPAVVADIQIASRLPTTSDELLMISSGRGRLSNSSDENGQYQFSGGDYGFFVSNTQKRVWGTNQLASPATVSGAVRSGNRLWINSNFNDQIGYVTQFDRGLDSNGNPLSDGSLPDEAQAAGGDSGGPVFLKDNGQWYLSGVMHAIYLDQGQSAGEARFGNHTAISDLSMDHYADQIAALRASSEYSAMGDLDLDGAITGGVVGGVASGDLAAMVDGWMMEFDEPDIHSWMHGDLNQDGITDIGDFVLLRDALGGSISFSSFATLVSGVGIPEPGSAALIVSAVLCLTARRRS